MKIFATMVYIVQQGFQHSLLGYFLLRYIYILSPIQMWFPIPCQYVHPVTLELDTNLESGTCLRISGAWTQIHCQNQLIKIAITNLYSQKSLKQTTRKKQKTWKTYERTKHTKLYVFKKTAPPCPVDPISSCAIPSQPRARRSSSILTSSMHRKMVVNCSTYVGWSLGVGFNVDSTFTVSYALVLGGVVVDIYI